MRKEVLVSVDVETSGPNPSTYSMLSLGACLVCDLTKTFYVEFKPTSKLFIPKALEVSGLSLEQLEKTGEEPEKGMIMFDQWIHETVKKDRPIFTAFNATFDWMFVADYFQRFLGNNPFGISGLDIKAYYMGKFGTAWLDTIKRNLDLRFIPDNFQHTHNALDDAVEQAQLFRNILEYPNHDLK